MRKLTALVCLIFALTACDCHHEDTELGIVRGLLSDIPAGEKVYLDPQYKDLTPKGVTSIALPAELRRPDPIAPGIRPARVTLPHTPDAYTEEVKYLVLAQDGLPPMFGCLVDAWEQVGYCHLPGKKGLALWRRKNDAPIVLQTSPQPSLLINIKPQNKNLSPFALEKTEVTYAQFVGFLNEVNAPPLELAQWFDLGRPDNPVLRQNGRFGVYEACAEHPVAYISFKGAHAYCRHIKRRLPDSEQWQIAAMGDKNATYPWGEDDNVSRYANSTGEQDGYFNSSPVGAFPQGATADGLLDMAGNAFEWTTSGNQPVLRGGSWATGDEWLRNSATESNLPHARNNHNGFRCAASPTRGSQ